jgi:hypothetical protein
MLVSCVVSYDASVFSHIEVFLRMWKKSFFVNSTAWELIFFVGVRKRQKVLSRHAHIQSFFFNSTVWELIVILAMHTL